MAGGSWCVGRLLLGLSAFATAENAARVIRASAANVPTNISSIHTYAAPPKGFDPLAATDIERATYGFPARSDKQANPDQYALWERAMNVAKIRWSGELKPPIDEHTGRSGPTRRFCHSRETMHSTHACLHRLLAPPRSNKRNSCPKVSSFTRPPFPILPVGVMRY
jgi:hypothetical protein